MKALRTVYSPVESLVCKALRYCEYWLSLIGVLALGVYGAASIHSYFLQIYDHWTFDQSLKGQAISFKAFLADRVLGLPGEPRVTEKPAPQWLENAADQSKWSAKRKRAYQRSLSAGLGPPLGLLQIPSLGLSVTVREGTDEWTLNRAVGHIEGTALPGEPGNVAIAGHRDGYFRCLRNISNKDRIRLTTLKGIYEYQVNHIQVVRPDDVHVLNSSRTPTLTLVTCYPFYYVGDAPQRFIVKGELISEEPVSGLSQTAVR